MSGKTKRGAASRPEKICPKPNRSPTIVGSIWRGEATQRYAVFRHLPGNGVSVVCFDEVQRLFTCAGALLRQGLPLAVHHPNRDGGFGLRYTAFGFALEGRDVIPVVQFELQPLVMGFTVIPGVFLQFQGTGYPDQAAFSHFAFDQVLCTFSVKG